MKLKFESTYASLPESFYQKLQATNFKNPHILRWNNKFSESFGIFQQDFNNEDLAKIFSAGKIEYGINPLAQAYSGHQFGNFNPHLGDGRALLLGEIRGSGDKLFDIHLKGSGPTQFSRRGDGFAQLGAVIREYLVSESMAALSIPTTRTMAIIGTGQAVQREDSQPGAIQVRLARAHIRVGTFEHFAARRDDSAVKILADYTIDRLHPDISKDQEGYLELYRRTIQNQVQLVSSWMSVGFIHGVMNTDNTSIACETIDFGPCAFMEAYKPLQVFSSIDVNGRYAYARQPGILKWNLSCFGYCLLGLLDSDRVNAEKIIENELSKFDEMFDHHWLEKFSKKFGFEKFIFSQVAVIREYLDLLEANELDFTLGFYLLSKLIQAETPEQIKKIDEIYGFKYSDPKIQNWIANWKSQLASEGLSIRQAQSNLLKVNPAIIARNHLVQDCISEAVTQNSWVKFDRLAEAVKRAYLPMDADLDLMLPATPEQAVHETFCNT